MKSWQIAKIIKNRVKKPYKKMKDRDMSGTIIVFNKSHSLYHLEKIIQNNRGVTINYLANLAHTSFRRYWTHHGGGGYVTSLVLDGKHYKTLSEEIERLNGKIAINNNDCWL